MALKDKLRNIVVVGTIGLAGLVGAGGLGGCGPDLRGCLDDWNPGPKFRLFDHEKLGPDAYDNPNTIRIAYKKLACMSIGKKQEYLERFEKNKENYEPYFEYYRHGNQARKISDNDKIHMVIMAVLSGTISENSPNGR